ncbi:MAG: hypothetical protein FJY73_03915 [Candidatus Eisenbacteria bacterium]|nr:hypothetical protein [Candidatus Eisenbacteria bacterium]
MDPSQALREWLANEEELLGFLQERKWFSKRFLVLTDHRLILFERRFWGRLKDLSDKQWRQFIDVHLEQGFFSSSMRLTFFTYHDSIAYHDPHNPKQIEAQAWVFDNLDKKGARHAYVMLKAKEGEWKERRLREQIEREKSCRAVHFHGVQNFPEGRDSPT